MIVRGRDFDDIYDLIGIRVLVDTVRDCYAVLGPIHARWTPLPGRFKDYIAMPKFNLYQSLHTTVIGPGGKPVEIQIRTHEMHQRAEYGVAAHWKYKERLQQDARSAPRNRTWPGCAHYRLAAGDLATPDEFLDSLRFEINAAEVYVFTPKGEVIGLPAGATPVDFAYAVHTEVGHRTIGAKVNGKLVPLDSELTTATGRGLHLEDRGRRAQPGLADFVKSPRARNKIRQWFTKERREEAIEQGKELLTQGAAQAEPAAAEADDPGLALAVAQDCTTRTSPRSTPPSATGTPRRRPSSSTSPRWWAGTPAASRRTLAETPISTAPSRPKLTLTPACWSAARRHPGQAGPLLHPGAAGSDHRVRHPRLRGLGAPHRLPRTSSSCEDQPDRMVEVEWAPTQVASSSWRSRSRRWTASRLLSDVTRVLSENHVNILSASVSTSSDRLAISQLRLRDGRPEAPRPRAQRGAPDRRRLRRLPHHRRHRRS